MVICANRGDDPLEVRKATLASIVAKASPGIRDYAELFSVHKVPMVRVEHQFPGRLLVLRVQVKLEEMLQILRKQR